MFTGIIADVGEVLGLRQVEHGVVLRVHPSKEFKAKVSDSIAVNGVCLTLTDVEGGVLCFDCVRETLERSTLSSLRQGVRVNLEKALGAGDPLGGHFVQGHVDGRGLVTEVSAQAADRTIRVDAPAEVMGFVVEKGSIAMDGVSLTVASATEGSFSVKIVPYTWSATTLREMKPGDEVNLEADILAKYVDRMLQLPRPGALTAEMLRGAGF